MLSILKINHNRFSKAMSNELPNWMFLNLLDVSNNNVLGKIPTWIYNQTSFVSLLLGNNYFEGQIPCETFDVAFLDFSHNLLSGSLPLRSSNIIKYLYLEDNNFSGSIPNAFFNISDLKTLDASDNRLSGSIPSAIANMALSLRILLLGGNRLSGTFPTQLCQLTHISLMDLSRNFFSRTIPHCFQHLVTAFTSFELLYSAQTNNKEHSEEYGEQDEVNFVTKYWQRAYKGNILTYMSGLDLSCICNNLTGAAHLNLDSYNKFMH